MTKEFRKIKALQDKEFKKKKRKSLNVIKLYALLSDEQIKNYLKQ